MIGTQTTESRQPLVNGRRCTCLFYSRVVLGALRTTYVSVTTFSQRHFPICDSDWGASKRWAWREDPKGPEKTPTTQRSGNDLPSTRVVQRPSPGPLFLSRGLVPVSGRRVHLHDGRRVPPYDAGQPDFVRRTLYTTSARNAHRRPCEWTHLRVELRRAKRDSGPAGVEPTRTSVAGLYARHTLKRVRYAGLTWRSWPY